MCGQFTQKIYMEIKIQITSDSQNVEPTGFTVINDDRFEEAIGLIRELSETVEGASFDFLFEKGLIKALEAKGVKV